MIKRGEKYYYLQVVLVEVFDAENIWHLNYILIKVWSQFTSSTPSVNISSINVSFYKPRRGCIFSLAIAIVKCNRSKVSEKCYYKPLCDILTCIIYDIARKKKHKQKFWGSLLFLN